MVVVVAGFGLDYFRVFVDPAVNSGAWIVDIGGVGATVGVYVVHFFFGPNVWVEVLEPRECLVVCWESFIPRIRDAVDGGS